MSYDERMPDFFDSLAAICKFVAVKKIDPEFYDRYYHPIEFTNGFTGVLAGFYPPLGDAFRRGLPLSVPEAAEILRKLIPSLGMSEEHVKWIDPQMTETLKVLIAVVRDPALPPWLAECRGPIEKAFHIQ